MSAKKWSEVAFKLRNAESGGRERMPEGNLSTAISQDIPALSQTTLAGVKLVLDMVSC